MRSRMAGRSILYCSPSFIVATRLLAAMIASGDGVCADAAKGKQRKLPAMINKRLHMEKLPRKGRPKKLPPIEQQLATPGSWFLRHRARVDWTLSRGQTGRALSPRGPET